MGAIGKIVCKTAGAAGMGLALYDAFLFAGANSKRYSQKLDADHFERVLADTRTLEKESEFENAVQKKVADFRMKSPIVNIYGKVKGYISGFFHSLGENIVPVSFASLALAGKGFFSKLGAWGLALYGAYTVAKEGFGFGKHTPMD